MGAHKVIGLDIRESVLNVARQAASSHFLGEEIVFTTNTETLADIIISLDSFEHFADPVAELQVMNSLLKPTGFILVAFGPTWFHPYGGHYFSVFPWAHLIFSEKALIHWRSKHKTDGARRFSEVEGGLNQITIGHFRKIVNNSPFHFKYLKTIPIKGIKIFQYRMLQEIGSALVICKLERKELSI